ncbi:Cof-type HAD-IIB family hydrolase [Clostridium formicaceticum]|uniref:HAD family hydrolase n=1 Tax=Clostridium formicaceticum TaxID=1497 RepID=A0AAC9WER3_9CLOT|nr:Cof-type HAD-IIB family hydrolase [Clostridium formicaceticum]AOY75717.1 HAD family hydrolase [Clostridium formicaceticum]ARE86037.1 Sugar phosphatase YidA [Clostridium formicaceticum]
MRYKLVVLDMDGTLLDDHHQVSEKNKKIIQHFSKEGIQFILASGRPYASLYPYVKDLGLQLPVIAANGAVVKCPLTHKTHYESVVPLELAQEILDYGKAYAYSISCYFEDEVITFDERMVKVHWELEKLKAKMMDKFLVEKAPNKMIYSAAPQKIEKAFKFLANKYSERLYITCSADIYLDVMNLGTSKGRALSHILSQMNISSSEVMVIGNNFNDLAMFEVAGLAVAMANSPEKVKHEADFITKLNTEDGVAYALEQLIT